MIEGGRVEEYFIDHEHDGEEGGEIGLKEEGMGCRQLVGEEARQHLMVSLVTVGVRLPPIAKNPSRATFLPNPVTSLNCLPPSASILALFTVIELPIPFPVQAILPPVRVRDRSPDL